MVYIQFAKLCLEFVWLVHASRVGDVSWERNLMLKLLFLFIFIFFL